MATKANIKGDLLHMTIGGTAGPFDVNLSIADLLDLFPVKSARTGTSTVATLVQGHGGTVTAETQEWVATEIKRALGVASADPVALGGQMPTHTVTLHDPADGTTTTGDIHFFACVFANFRRTVDGQGAATMQFDLMAEQDASGKVWTIGAPG